MTQALHIICFDIPYPANYGGAMDVFHKVRWLHRQGVEIYLHCFEYGDRRPSEELDRLCKKVYYYKRRTGIRSLLSRLPYNVVSRYSEELLQNIAKQDAPVLCEVLHTCYVMKDPRLHKRLKIYREVNIEHEYYRHLAGGEKSLIKRLYLRWEAAKLERYENILKQADAIVAVSTTDRSYFQKQYPGKPCTLVPCFHEYDEVDIRPGKSDYILYHGNLGVSENYMAAAWLIDHVFSKISYKVVIAGLNPPPFLKQKITAYSHIELKENCSTEEMNQLISDAQVHCLYTQQATGLKLKLLNALYRGRFVIANDAMLSGTTLHEACIVANTAQEFIKAIQRNMQQELTPDEIAQRKALVAAYDNAHKANVLMSVLNNSSKPSGAIE